MVIGTPRTFFSMRADGVVLFRENWDAASWGTEDKVPSFQVGAWLEKKIT
jgi:hypothetical protein